MRDFDVIVVGGGPAGAISAIKCSQLGFKTALVEKGTLDRHKTCGGVIPDICNDMLNDIGLRIPSEVMSSPTTIGLFYVPPSGKNNGGYVNNYRLLNVDRDKFDRWLRDAAGSLGSEILHNAEFMRFEENRNIEAIVRANGNMVRLSTRYLVGADGTFSSVRRQLYPYLKMSYLPILQERWSAEGDFGQYFYAFFNGDITDSYSYMIPKDGNLIVGTGVPRHNGSAQGCIIRFKQWLRQEFHFRPITLQRREASAIPYGLPLVCGNKNVVLVGDAAGFCNRLSGEGVRPAIQSSMAACEAIIEADSKSEFLSSLYVQHVQPLLEFIMRTHEFAQKMTDTDREEFVRTELARTSLEK